MIIVAIAMFVVVRVSMTVAMVAMVFVLPIVIPVVVVVFLMEFVSVKLVFPAAVSAPVGMFAATRKRSPISVMRIVVMVDVAVEAFRPAKPGPGAKKHTSGKPLRPVIAKWRAPVRRVIEIAVGANRSYSDANADLCFCIHA